LIALAAFAAFAKKARFAGLFLWARPPMKSHHKKPPKPRRVRLRCVKTFAYQTRTILGDAGTE
jgi:hypothetical protein